MNVEAVVHNRSPVNFPAVFHGVSLCAGPAALQPPRRRAGQRPAAPTKRLFAAPHSNADPLPIPGGSPALGGGFHVYGPTPDGSFDPIDAEPSTITNFNGVVGLTYVSGTVSRRKIGSNVQVEVILRPTGLKIDCL